MSHVTIKEVFFSKNYSERKKTGKIPLLFAPGFEILLETWMLLEGLREKDESSQDTTFIPTE